MTLTVFLSNPHIAPLTPHPRQHSVIACMRHDDQALHYCHNPRSQKVSVPEYSCIIVQLQNLLFLTPCGIVYSMNVTEMSNQGGRADTPGARGARSKPQYQLLMYPGNPDYKLLSTCMGISGSGRC